MKTSEAINELAEALSKAQAVMQPAIKDSTNPAFNSKYADLSAVWEVARKPLTDNGLCIIQFPTHSEDGRVHLTTRLAHKSGQWVEEEMGLPAPKDNAHGYGSAITYCKRFALSAVLGIVADVDDDGNEASKPKAPNASSAAAAKLLERPSDAKQEGREILEQMSIADQQDIRDAAIVIIDAHENGRAADAIAGYNFDNEQKLAIWSLLPSNVRSAIKKAKTNGELATQP